MGHRPRSGRAGCRRCPLEGGGRCVAAHVPAATPPPSARPEPLAHEYDSSRGYHRKDAKDQSVNESGNVTPATIMLFAKHMLEATRPLLSLHFGATQNNPGENDMKSNQTEKTRLLGH